MMAQLEARAAPERTAEEDNNVFPLEEPRPQVRSRQPLLFGAGMLGTAAVGMVRARRPALAPLCLTEGATADDLQRAARALSSPAGSGGWVLCEGRLDLLATGQPKDLEAAIGPLVERLAGVADGSTVSLTTLELGDPCDGAALNAPWNGPPVRYHLARNYYHGLISLEHQVDLASRLLAAGLPSALAERADVARASGAPVIIGGALLWEPEATIEEVVALELAMQCFRMIASPGQGAIRRLSSLLRGTIPGPLSLRLREQFRREEEEFVERYSTMPETAPVEGLLEGAHAGEPEASRAACEWCAGNWRAIRSGLYEVLTGRYGLRTALVTVDRVERDLRQAGEGLAARENEKAAKRRSLVRRAVALDQKRREAARRWSPAREILSWLQGRRVKKALAELFRERTDELLIRYERTGIQQLCEEIAALRERLAGILNASPADDDLEGLVRSAYPNLVARHEPETIKSAAESLVLGLGIALRDAPVKKAWARAARQLLNETAGPKGSRNAIAVAAKAVAEGLPGAPRPFADALDEMLPDRSAMSLGAMLTWAARPHILFRDSSSWVEEIVPLPGEPRKESNRPGDQGQVCPPVVVVVNSLNSPSP